MKSDVILIFSCFFTLLLATAAQASEFTGNSCNEEGANCQTQSDWMIGWCEAASAAGAVNQTVEECTESVGANHANYQVPAQDYKNAQDSASNSGKSSGGAKSKTVPKQSRNAQDSAPGSGQAAAAQEDESGGAPSSAQECRYYVVRRSDPGNQICVPHGNS